MNHFIKYYDKIDKKSDIFNIIEKFDIILDNIWCSYSMEKGYSQFNKIYKNINPLYGNKIATEIQHVCLGHGVYQARNAVKSEMEKYIEYLIKNKDCVKL